MITLSVYSREGCHLCEEMLAALVQFKTELGFEFEVYDIDEDAALLQEYNALVPVVKLGERELMRYYFELATLKAALNIFREKT
ncbi:MAG: glutaredoxin family protein [Arenicellales bacterium]